MQKLTVDGKVPLNGEEEVLNIIDDILGNGGSIDPDEMMKNFLGREPNQDTFFKDMGL